MTTQVEEYLSKVELSKRVALEAIRTMVKRLIPEAEEGMSYGMPAFKLNGKAIAGYAAFKNHCSYFPMSGKVIDKLADELRNYKCSTGGFQFDPAEPPPEELVRKLLDARLAELGANKG